MQTSIYYVHGDQDNYTYHNELEIPFRLNIDADKLATTNS